MASIRARTPEQVELDRREAEEVLEKSCLFDDILARFFFKGNNIGAQQLLRAYLGRDDLTVTRVRTQEHFGHIGAKDLIMDLTATDDRGNRYNVEFQRASEGASFARMVHHGSALTLDSVRKGGDPRDLPERYVICLTERDVAQGEGPVVWYERVKVISRATDEKGRRLVTGEETSGDVHYVYVACSYRKEGDPVGDMNHDLFQTDPAQLKNAVLAKQMANFKTGKGGRKMNSREIEEILHRRDERSRAEGMLERAKATARALLAKGIMSIADIAECSGLTVAEVEALKTA